MVLGVVGWLVAYAGPTAPLAADELHGGPGEVDAPALPVMPDLPRASPEVVGGSRARAGAWPDTALVFDGGGSCTGVLIHPRWVLTAGHCVAGSSGGEVFLDVTTMGEVWQRETRDGRKVTSRDVARAVPHPKYEGYGYDIALLKLDEPVENIPPRTIARDCVVEETLEKGAPVIIVGWGATNADGSGGGYTLQAGRTEVQTPDCRSDQIDGMYTGCDPSARPGGEIGAGGDGVDACFGDSGGPLYIESDAGTWLIGITSRSYAGVPWNTPCGYGGIYTRPDSVIDWIERTVGEPLPRPACSLPPEASAEPVVVRPGGRERVALTVDDPDGEAWTVEVVSPPAHGAVEVKGDKAFYVAEDGYEGEDRFVLRVVDDASPEWPDNPGTVDVAVPVTVTMDAGCGCAVGPVGPVGPVGSSAGAGLLAAAAWLRRRGPPAGSRRG